jgi:D-arabinose 1-dehydrogenase-like Zn-dependent alcohol dehydrogenase
MKIAFKRFSGHRQFSTSTKKMRAITCSGKGGPEVLQVESNVEIPECKEGQSLIRIEATAVNRADILQRQGRYPPPKGASNIIGLECTGYKVDPKTLEPIEANK